MSGFRSRTAWLLLGLIAACGDPEPLVPSQTASTPIATEESEGTTPFDSSSEIVEPVRDPAMELWVAQTDTILGIVGRLTHRLRDIRAEFARCDFSNMTEFNSLYFEGKEELKFTVRQNRPPSAAIEAQNLLLTVLEIEIQADSVRSTDAMLDLAEGTTSGCSGGETNDKDADAEAAKGQFLAVYEPLAGAHGGRQWSVDDF